MRADRLHSQTVAAALLRTPFSDEASFVHARVVPLKCHKSAKYELADCAPVVMYSWSSVAPTAMAMRKRDEGDEVVGFTRVHCSGDMPVAAMSKLSSMMPSGSAAAYMRLTGKEAEKVGK